MTLLNDCINFQLNKLGKMVSRYFSEKLMVCDITPVQYSVLKCLWVKDFQAPSQISQTLSLDSSSLTGLLDRMESKGLLRRIPDSEDRRAIQVILTPQGKALEQPTEKLIEEANVEVLQCLTEKEKMQLFNSLNKIADNSPFSKS